MRYLLIIASLCVLFSCSSHRTLEATQRTNETSYKLYYDTITAIDSIRVHEYINDSVHYVLTDRVVYRNNKEFVYNIDTLIKVDSVYVESKGGFSTHQIDYKLGIVFVLLIAIVLIVLVRH